MKKEPRIVCIGGGTGTYSVLTGLKHYPVDITAIVSMSDTGGSAATERDQFGLLPSSDIRKSLVALSDSQSEEDNVLRELFQYRYTQGSGVAGMTFGNLFLVALTKLLGSQTKAIETAGQILRIRGRVLPVTLDSVNLVATYTNGTKVIGEHLIDEPKHDGTLRIKNLSIKPRASVYPPVISSLASANLIVLGPGGLYTTLLANIVIPGVAQALQKSRARIVLIMNLMTEYGQTYEMSAHEHVLEIEKYIGTKRIDYVLMNTSPLPVASVAKYQKAHAVPVIDDLSGPNVIRDDFISPLEIKRDKGDTLKRSFIRHDPMKLAKTIVQLAL